LPLSRQAEPRRSRLAMELRLVANQPPENLIRIRLLQQMGMDPPHPIPPLFYALQAVEALADLDGDALVPVRLRTAAHHDETAILASYRAVGTKGTETTAPLEGVEQSSHRLCRA